MLAIFSEALLSMSSDDLSHQSATPFQRLEGTGSGDVSAATKMMMKTTTTNAILVKGKERRIRKMM